MIVNGAVLSKTKKPKTNLLSDYVRRYYKRRDKNPMELARLCRDLKATTGDDAKAAARAAQISEASFSNYLGLLRLPDAMKTAVRDGKLGYKSARALSRLPHYQAKQIWTFMKANGLVGGDVERVCSLAMQHPSKTPEDLWNMSLGRPVKGKQPSRIARYIRPAPQKPVQIKPEELMQVAGHIEALKPASDIERMPLLTQLQILKKRVDAKLEELS